MEIETLNLNETDTDRIVCTIGPYPVVDKLSSTIDKLDKCISKLERMERNNKKSRWINAGKRR